MTSVIALDDPIDDDPARRRAVALAVRHVNVSTPFPLTDADLMRAIRSGRPAAAQENQLFAFVDETDRATLCDLVITGAATYRQLATLAARLLPLGHRNRTWLDDRRDL